MKKLLVATGNPNKIKEIKMIFEGFNYEVELINPKDLGEFDEPIENGTTYEENAVIKANHFYNLFHFPTIADDSGMRIKFLNDFPGIYSARFMGSHSYEEKNDALIQILDDAPYRDAYFDCVVTYIDENGKITSFEGVNEGSIAYKQSGCEGFGYDPIFIPNGESKTEAELGLAYKNRYSHRAKAIRKLVDYLNEKEK